MKLKEIDPSNLILESYRIDGIDAGECRSIFLDWALKIPEHLDQAAALDTLIAQYAEKSPDHPMSAVLRQAKTPAKQTGRRGGRAARVGN